MMWTNGGEAKVTWRTNTNGDLIMTEWVPNLHAHPVPRDFNLTQHIKATVRETVAGVLREEIEAAVKKAKADAA